MFTVQSLLFPFPVYLPPICIWRLKSQQKLSGVQGLFVFFSSSYCPNNAMLPPAWCIYMYRRVLRHSPVIFLLSFLSIQNCVWNYCASKTVPWATLCFASKGKCFADSYWTSGIVKTIKFNWQSHPFPQMLKLPLPQLHLNHDVPSIFRWITGIWWSSLTERQAELHPNLRNSAITTSLVPIVSSILKGQE